MLVVQPEASGRHQPARYNRPGGNQPDKRNNGEARPEKSDHARGDIEQAFKYQQPPAVLLAADRPYRRNDSEDAVDQHIGGEQQYQRQYRWTGKDQREDSKDDA